MKINYYTEPVKEYNEGLDAAQNKVELTSHIYKFRLVAKDALIAARMITDFVEFKKGLLSERKKKYAGEEWAKKYGVILMPDVMFECSIVAGQFQVPWGLAYIRLRDVGQIVEKGGYAYLVKSDE